MNNKKNIGHNKTIQLWKFAVNLNGALITIEMAPRKVLENFLQILSLHNQRKHKVTNFAISLKIKFLSAAI